MPGRARSAAAHNNAELVPGRGATFTVCAWPPACPCVLPHALGSTAGGALRPGPPARRLRKRVSYHLGPREGTGCLSAVCVPLARLGLQPGRHRKRFPWIPPSRGPLGRTGLLTDVPTQFPKKVREPRVGCQTKNAMSVGVCLPAPPNKRAATAFSATGRGCPYRGHHAASRPPLRLTAGPHRSGLPGR